MEHIRPTKPGTQRHVKSSVPVPVCVQVASFLQGLASQGFFWDQYVIFIKFKLKSFRALDYCQLHKTDRKSRHRRNTRSPRDRDLSKIHHFDTVQMHIQWQLMMKICISQKHAS